MPKCTINGKEVEVKDGSTIIEAITQAGQRIAHYCWHPGLSVAGVCRLCMVEIDGNPRLQIACNTTVTEGMKINNTSDKVKEAVKWGLDFHLINHPLDCPICDQAGECGLQDQYMEYGKYDPEMSESKQKKHKVVDLGDTVVLDSERCILCSRCVRFTTEVSKTNELGIFNRGDRSEIGTHAGKKLDNKYSLNTVDICPVGALTSKDFRFRQRVWYLKDAETICTGCSTGCNVKVYFNKEGFFRVKPVYNPEVNGYWMCDEGRDIYKHLNKEYRLMKAKVGAGGSWMEKSSGEATKELANVIKSHSGDAIALVLTGQYSSEEYESIIGTFKSQFNSSNVFHWLNNEDKMKDFDGLLLRGDKNPNTKGLISALSKHGINKKWSDLEKGLTAGTIKTLIVAGPENQATFSDIADKVQKFRAAQNLVWLAPGKYSEIDELKGNVWCIPTKTYVEKSGTFVNFSGKEQKFKKVTTIVSDALTLSDFAALISGKNIDVLAYEEELVDINRRPDVVTKEMGKKNEFVYRRGNL